MHLLLHDYANYAFTKQLAAQLVAAGIKVTYAYNSQYDGPNSKADPAIAGGARLLPVRGRYAGRPSESFFNRLRMELAYASELAAQVQALGADVILSADSPSLVQNRLAKQARRLGVPLLSWVQDLYGVAATKLLSKRLPIVGAAVGRYFIALDKQSLQLSQQAILITEDFKQFAHGAGLADDRLHVIENWAPIQEIPRVAKRNAWAQSQGLSDVFRFVYSGTLAMKHNPELLVRLAESLRAQAERQELPPAEVLVVSSSPGAGWLAEQVRAKQLNNVRILEFQPAADFPSILGSADVLLAVLEQDAAAFSVPSKVLSYLCAGKPILAAIPGANLASRIISGARAGTVVEPSQPDQFAAAGVAMMTCSPAQHQAWGVAARQYAEQNFDLSRIAGRFLAILNSAVGQSISPCQPPAQGSTVNC